MFLGSWPYSSVFEAKNSGSRSSHMTSSTAFFSTFKDPYDYIGPI